MQERPSIARAMHNYGRLVNAIMTSWVINLGRRDALERMAHLICEVHARLVAVRAANCGRFYFPLTQEDFADAVGLTPVHINRKLQQMRHDRMIALRARQLAILDVRHLQQTAGFNGQYLCPFAEEQGRTPLNAAA